MKQFALLLLIIVSACATTNAQINVGSSQAPDNSAMLQVSGTTKGFLPPRMSRTEMNAISQPAKGLIVFSTTDSALFMRRDTGWVKLLGDAATGTSNPPTVVTANGLAGTVSASSAITLSTTVTGIVKGNGTAFSAASASDFPTLNQNTTGTASNITGVLNPSSFPALTGDVTTTAGSVTTTIANGAVSNAKLATMPANTFKANNTGSTAAPNNITGTQATAMLDLFTSTTKGLVPASGGVANTFLRSDGTFQPVSGASGGTVTSVSVTSVNGVSGTVTNPTTTPAINLTLGAITPASVAASGDISTTGSVYVDINATNSGAKTPGVIFGGAGSGETISSKRTTGGNLYGLDFYTNNTNRMSITQGGNVGIGVTTPAYKLHVVSNSDPLYLAGVNTGTTTSADSILTITSGVVKKIPITSFATPSNAWSISGNSGTTVGTHFLGTIDNKSLAFRTNNTQRMLLDENGNVAVGTGATFSASPEKFLVDAGATQSFNVISGKGNINNYLQLNIQNKNAGGAASSDVVATADNGDEANNYVDMGINSSGNTANYFGGANDAYLYNIGQNFLIGTGSTGKSMVFMTGGSTQSVNERMRIDGNGNVGIGISAPTSKLHVVGTNPLTLTGVQTGTSTSADSLLTITSGVVKKLPLSSFDMPGANWSIVGNNNVPSGSAFLGTTYNMGLKFRTNNTQLMLLDSLGNVAIGSSPSQTQGTNTEKLLVDAGNTNSINVISGKGSLNNYLQLNIQNRNGGSNASSDVVATADNGDESNNYVDLGINSSGNTANYFGGANDAYLYAQSQNMLIGTASGGKSIAFLTGGGTQSSNERMRIDGSGNVGIGISAPTAKLHVVGTNPLTLMGVQTGTSTSLDSVLTITSGVVKKLPASAFLSSSGSGYWSLAGNNNTAATNSFLGTTNADPLIFKINSQPAGRLDATNTFFGSYAGNNNGTNASQTTGIGYHAAFSNTTGLNNTALGYNSLPNNTTGSYNIGIGYNADVVNNSSNSILIGSNTVANNSYSIAMGASAQTNNTNAISIGNNTYTSGNYGISIGSGLINGSPKTQAYGDYSMALGYNAYAGGANSISIGTGTNSGQANGISLGNNTAASGLNSTAIGYNAAATQDNTIVLGDKNNSSVSVAIGPESFSAGNREKLLVDAGASTSFNVISGKGNTNNYLQLNIQNRNGGSNASSDLVATADNGDENNNYVDLGINSSGNTSNYFGAANDAYLYAQTQNMLVGTANPFRSVVFLTGGGSLANNERMRIDGSGNVGIGVSAPTAKLHVVGTNPLTLLGVQTGTSTVADSLLTITSGIVKKLPLSTFGMPGSDWSITGNNSVPSGSAFLGTTYNMGLKFRTNNTQLMLLDSLGNVAIGNSPSQTQGTNAEKLLVDAGNTNSINVISGKGSLNNYLQLNIQNRNNGGNASSDVVATADNGDELNNYVDLGINSSGNTANYFGGANDAYLYAQSQNMLIGTVSANKNVVFLTGGGNQGSNERMRIDGSGNVGIGISAPTAKLHVVGTNPLTLMGVQTGTSTSTDSLLTIASGVVKKLPVSTFSTAGSNWSITGNSNAPSGTAFMGTTNNAGLKFRTNNTQAMLVDSLGNVAVGSSPIQSSGTSVEKFLVDAGTSSSINVISGKGNTNNYLQLNIQNRNGGNIASSDLVATADNGDETSNFVDLGINSSGNTANYFGGANDAYLYAQSQNMLIGTVSSKSVVFMTGGPTQSSNERMRIDGTGKVGIGVAAPTATLQLKAGTATANTAPIKLTSGTNLSTPENGAVEYDGTNYFVTSGATRYTMAKTLTTTAVLNFPATAVASYSSLTVSVPGAVDGDVVCLGVPSAAGSVNGAFTGYVSSANTVTVKFSNGAGGQSDPLSGTFRISVLRY